ncbi:MAG: tRNA pseudouridine(55) synthase TruB [Clostridia bacterium]|nr:tRNA pseudouridine(55) synthase TruB [Clostridia bacterium]
MTGFVFLNKDEGMTSFFAASRLRRIFSTKKVGHTGTLDPMATGVLPVAVGGATRFIDFIPDSDKSYRARFLLGKTTDTLDITGQVLTESEVNVKREDIEKIIPDFTGEIFQVPPMYSALKKDGVRLYDLARQGIEVEREKRQITVYSLSLTDYEGENEFEIDVSCSKGTYIRTLIDDMGKRLGCGAVMTKLERTKANGVDIADCLTLEELTALCEKGEEESSLHTVDRLIPYDIIKVTDNQAKRFSNGGELDTERLKIIPQTGLYKVYSREGRFLGLGEITEDKIQLKVKRVYVEL